MQEIEHRGLSSGRWFLSCPNAFGPTESEHYTDSNADFFNGIGAERSAVEVG
jgi:hypothetical protein